MIYAIECYGPAGKANYGGMEAAEADKLYEQILPSIKENGGEIFLYAIPHNGQRFLVSSMEIPRKHPGGADDMESHEALGLVP